jgi:hypothetical protein
VLHLHGITCSITDEASVLEFYFVCQLRVNLQADSDIVRHIRATYRHHRNVL